jgi:hypothetical protein
VSRLHSAVGRKARPATPRGRRRTA